MDLSTLRILCLPGGGIRGIITAHFLEKFCLMAGIPLDKLWAYFNIITGTSIGGIQTLAYGIGKTPTETKQLLIDNGGKIFDANNPVGGQASIGTWLLYGTGAVSSLYPNADLISLCQNFFGQAKLSDMKTNILVPSFKTLDKDGNRADLPVYFSNISNSTLPVGILSGDQCLASDVALATSAAPVYFPAYTFNNPNYGELNGTYIDGGLMLNNPGRLAMETIKALYPTRRRICIITVGNGLGTVGRQPSPDPSPPPPQSGLGGPIDNMSVIKSVIDIATGVPPECVALEIEMQAKHTLDQVYSYHFQYQLTNSEHPNADLDNASEGFTSYMMSSCDAHFNSTNEQRKLQNFLNHFTL